MLSTHPTIHSFQCWIRQKKYRKRL